MKKELRIFEYLIVFYEIVQVLVVLFYQFRYVILIENELSSLIYCIFLELFIDFLIELNTISVIELYYITRSSLASSSFHLRVCSLCSLGPTI